MTDEAHDKLVEIFFRAFPAVDGAELGAVLEAVRRVLEEELRKACWLERRHLYARCMARLRN